MDTAGHYPSVQGEGERSVEPRKFASRGVANFLQRFPLSDPEGKGCAVLHKRCRWQRVIPHAVNNDTFSKV